MHIMIGSVFMPRYRLFLGQCTVHFWASARVNEIHIYSSSRVRISARGGLRGGRSHRKIVQKIEYNLRSVGCNNNNKNIQM